MQSLSLKNGALVEKVHVPSSKSYANRALILASLLKSPLKLKNLPHATDVTILIKCLEKIGLLIKHDHDDVEILNSFPECEGAGVELEVGEGGTTARFLAGMLLLGKRPYRLILGERLKERPWQEFIELATSLGAEVSLEGAVLSVKGPINKPVQLEIDCSKTTQFATAFQLMSLATGWRVTPRHMTSSQSYWAMTEKLVAEIVNLKEYAIPLDWSSASYPLAFAALNHPIAFPGLYPDQYQADSKFFKLLEDFHCLTRHDWGLEIHPLLIHRSVHFDVSDALDLVPTLGYFLAHIEGEHELKGIQNLVHKESDRLGEVIKLLKAFDRQASTDGSSLFIHGKRGESPEAHHLVMPDDHRMVMVGTLFLLHHGGGSIAPVSAVDKSYPEFFSLIKRAQ